MYMLQLCLLWMELMIELVNFINRSLVSTRFGNKLGSRKMITVQIWLGQCMVINITSRTINSKSFISHECFVKCVVENWILWFWRTQMVFQEAGTHSEKFISLDIVWVRKLYDTCKDWWVKTTSAISENIKLTLTFQLEWTQKTLFHQDGIGF